MAELIAHAPTAFTKFEVRSWHTFGFSSNRPGDIKARFPLPELAVNMARQLG